MDFLSERVSGSSTVPLLTSPGFLLAVTLLVLNDIWLKPEFGGWWTGKLSDFAGLYAFPLLLTALVPRARRWIFGFTAIAFLLWKSPLSSSPLLAWNRLGIWPLTRVIDYSDWIALVSLPFAYRTSYRAASPPRKLLPLGRLRALATGLFAIVAFAGTSRPAPRFAMEPVAGHFVGGPPQRVTNDLLASGLRRVSAPYDRPSRGGPDTLIYELTRTTGTWVVVTLELREAGCGSLLTPLSFQTMRKHPDIATIADSVYYQLIQPLQQRFSDCPAEHPQ